MNEESKEVLLDFHCVLVENSLDQHSKVLAPLKSFFTSYFVLELSMYCMPDGIAFKKLKVGNELDKCFVKHSSWTLRRMMSDNICTSLLVSHFSHFSYCLRYQLISLPVKKRFVYRYRISLKYGSKKALTPTIIGSKQIPSSYLCTPCVPNA